jgi:hypothetical protein
VDLSDAITRIADEANVGSSNTTVSSRIARSLNRVCSEMWDGFRWSFRWKNYRIVTDVDVASGTVTATNASRTVTASGTPFLSSHVDWHITFTGDAIQNWYKVRSFTSTSQIELDVPYQGTTGSAKSYILRHFDYVLPTEPWDLASVTITHARRPITIIEPTGIDIVGPVPLYSGYPTAASIYSSDSMPTTYSTGTLSGTINTNTVTGSGTSWLSNIYPGDSITIGSYSYTVQKVDSDTQLSLYNKQQVTSTAGTTYTITRQFGRVLRILWPSNNNYTLDIRAMRKYVPLVNNRDTNELLYRYPDTVVTKASALELKIQGDKRAGILLQQAEVMLARAKAEDDSLTPREAVAPIFTYRNSRGNSRLSNY